MWVRTLLDFRIGGVVGNTKLLIYQRRGKVYTDDQGLLGAAPSGTGVVRSFSLCCCIWRLFLIFIESEGKNVAPVA